MKGLGETVGIFRKSMNETCPYCGTEIRGTVPRHGHSTAQTRCPGCDAALGVVSDSGNVGLFIK